MPQITVYVASLNLPGGPPPLQLAGQSITSYLHGPTTPSGPAVEMLLDFSRYNVLTPIPGFSVTQTQLKSALAQLLGPPGQTPFPPIGLILTTLYAGNTSAEGFMFDTATMPGYPFRARQGCALFWNAIKTSAPNLPAAQERLAFQAVHELGHALNLWHVQPFEAPPNFMTAPPPDDFEIARLFVPAHAVYVSHAVDPVNRAYVLPGGSDFGVRGPLAPSGGEIPYAVNVRKSDLILTIDLSHRTFCAIEPVELDVTIELSETAKAKKHSIPAEIDPGYARFKLWLTLPNGERRLYRPGLQFCPTRSEITVSKTKPFRRDISILRCADGYTFGMSGLYTLEVTYSLGPRRILRSNKVVCNIRALPENSQSALAALWRPGAAELLHLKDAIPSPDLEAALAAFAEANPRSPASALIYYALGRARAKVAEAGVPLSPQECNVGKSYLTRALGARSLGNIRVRKGRLAMKTLSGETLTRLRP